MKQFPNDYLETKKVIFFWVSFVESYDVNVLLFQNLDDNALMADAQKYRHIRSRSISYLRNTWNNIILHKSENELLTRLNLRKILPTKGKISNTYIFRPRSKFKIPKRIAFIASSIGWSWSFYGLLQHQIRRNRRYFRAF